MYQQVRAELTEEGAILKYRSDSGSHVETFETPEELMNRYTEEIQPHIEHTGVRKIIGTSDDLLLSDDEGGIGLDGEWAVDVPGSLSELYFRDIIQQIAQENDEDIASVDYYGALDVGKDVGWEYIEEQLANPDLSDVVRKTPMWINQVVLEEVTHAYSDFIDDVWWNMELEQAVYREAVENTLEILPDVDYRTVDDATVIFSYDGEENQADFVLDVVQQSNVPASAVEMGDLHQQRDNTSIFGDISRFIAAD